MVKNLGLDRLERRDLMAVVVTFAPATGVLRIVGGGESETVDIDGTGVAGEVLVTEDPTGAAFSFGPFSGVRGIVASMGGGNDEVRGGALVIPGPFQFVGGPGNDLLLLDNTPNFGPAPDRPLFIGGNLTATMGGSPNDRVLLFADGGLGATLARNLTVTGASNVQLGSTTVGSSGWERTDLTVGGSLRVALAPVPNSNSQLVLTDVNVFGGTTVLGSAQADLVVFDNSNFLGRVSLQMGAGSDTVSLTIAGGTGSRFAGAVTFNLGPGFDVYDDSGSDLFAVPPKFIGGPEGSAP